MKKFTSKDKVLEKYINDWDEWFLSLSIQERVDHLYSVFPEERPNGVKRALWELKK